MRRCGCRQTLSWRKRAAQGLSRLPRLRILRRSRSPRAPLRMPPGAGRQTPRLPKQPPVRAAPPRAGRHAGDAPPPARLSASTPGGERPGGIGPARLPPRRRRRRRLCRWSADRPQRRSARRPRAGRSHGRRVRDRSGCRSGRKGLGRRLPVRPPRPLSPARGGQGKGPRRPPPPRSGSCWSPPFLPPRLPHARAVAPSLCAKRAVADMRRNARAIGMLRAFEGVRGSIISEMGRRGNSQTEGGRAAAGP